MDRTDWKIDTIRMHIQSLKNVKSMPVSKNLYIMDIEFLLEVIDNLIKQIKEKDVRP